jgi:hypothetical protein
MKMVLTMMQGMEGRESAEGDWVWYLEVDRMAED